MGTDILFPFVNFFLFLFLLLYFARKPFRAMVQEKRQRLEEQLESAESARALAEEKMRLLQSRMAGLEGDLRRLQQEAESRAAQLKKEIAQRGALLCQRIEQEVGTMTQEETQRAEAILREELLSLVEKAVREQIQQIQGKKEQKTLFSREIQTASTRLAEESL